MAEVRAQLLALADRHPFPDEAVTLRRLAEATRRKRAVRKAPPSSKPLTPELAVAIRAFAKSVPHYSMSQIGSVFGVNMGRVSEALARKI